MSTDHHWNPVLYDSKLQFVSQYGTDVVGWLSPQQEREFLMWDAGRAIWQLTWQRQGQE
ncbi:hypothetical protein PAALTS15_19888 [Paenibacillus alvei TS-15]|uniref:Uncharacterized protein n=1 Tax=Paenibacillus alvei TS-15 TaxID=1117108 RepID=S9TT25_PAEAL|nr:hypothetical protein [Paenibacillus alvei]EPY05461.1 hypothetical protein PAALTS15_19888 [Paenibacillus alvei TS-15]